MMPPFQFNPLTRRSKIELPGKLRTKIKCIGDKFRPLVKAGLFGRWHEIGWDYFNEQPGKGFTQCRASIKSPFMHDRDLIDALELVEDFKKYRGSGITIT